MMAAQKYGKKFFGEIFCISEPLLTLNPTNKIHNSLDSSRPYGRLLKIQKTGDFRELILPENHFQNSSAINFPKNQLDFGGLETNRRHEIQT